MKRTKWQDSLQHAAGSDIGMRRSNNQDSFAVHLASDASQWQRYGHLFLIADGMGAHAAGELASKLAADTVPHLYLKHDELSPPEAIETAFREANQEIHRRGQENLDFHNMGTTCSALLLLPQGALAAHVGDSRVYRLRQKRLYQLTFDHSLVWEMREAGQISDEDDTFNAIPKNVITRSLGPHPMVRVDLEGPFPIEIGDTFLLCSDGLSGCINDEELAAVLSSVPPAEAASLLIDMANLRGGPDNITVVIAKVVGKDLTSRQVRAEPLTVGAARDVVRSVHPGFWVATMVFALAALVMLAAGKPEYALASTVGSIIFALAALVQKVGPFKHEGVRLSGGRRLGKGPYRKTEEFQLVAFTKTLSDMAQIGKDNVEGRGWTVDWTTFDQDVQEAQRLANDGDLTESIQQHAKAFRFLVDFRKKHSQPDSFDLFP